MNTFFWAIDFGKPCVKWNTAAKAIKLSNIQFEISLFFLQNYPSLGLRFLSHSGGHAFRRCLVHWKQAEKTKLDFFWLVLSIRDSAKYNLIKVSPWRNFWFGDQKWPNVDRGTGTFSMVAPTFFAFLQVNICAKIEQYLCDFLQQKCRVNPIQTRLFLGSKDQGGGTLCPPSKNPVTLLRIHSSKLFLKACPKMNLLTQLWFPWKPWLGF